MKDFLCSEQFRQALEQWGHDVDYSSLSGAKRVSRAVPVFSLLAFMAWTGTNLFYFNLLWE
jgi:hypothetical protein